MYTVIVKLRVLSNFLVIDPFYQICPFCPSSATGWGGQTLFTKSLSTCFSSTLGLPFYYNLLLYNTFFFARRGNSIAKTDRGAMAGLSPGSVSLIGPTV